MITRGQSTIGTCYLIDIAISFEQAQSFLSLLQVGGMVSQCLLSLCLEIDISVAFSYTETTVQVVDFFLMDLFGSSFGKDTTCPDVIEIVEVLGGIVAHLVRIQLLKGLHTLTLQSYIIIIGGSDNSHFRFGIGQTLALTLRKLVTLFVDARQSLDSLFAPLVKLTILRTTLTEAHLLDITYQQFNLIVGKCYGFIQQTVGFSIIHGNQ